jgi:folate-binding protein YgfZ
MLDTRSQVEAAHRSVLAIPCLDLAALVVTGGDRLSWLNGLITCDLVKRASGVAAYGLVLARNGRVLSDATVVVDEARASVFLAVPRRVAPELREHLEHYLIMEDAEIAAPTSPADEFETWMFHGPGSAAILDAAMAAGAAGGAVDRAGLGGAFVIAPAPVSTPVRAAIELAVASAGGTVGDEAGWETLRLERGVPRFGVDFDDKTYPQEASLERTAVSFDKGCYLGQEVVCMLEMRGHVKRKLVPLLVHAVSPPEPGAPVTDEEGAVVGEVTSAAPSPASGSAMALAMLKRAYAEAGKNVVVAGGIRAEVVERPA